MPAAASHRRLPVTVATSPSTYIMCHAFPELWNIEKRFGSVIFGAVQSKIQLRRGTKGKLVLRIYTVPLPITDTSIDGFVCGDTQGKQYGSYGFNYHVLFCTIFQIILYVELYASIDALTMQVFLCMFLVSS
nr:protoporphyrinogen oxidase, mitochondrial [Ipomoea batatas]